MSEEMKLSNERMADIAAGLEAMGETEGMAIGHKSILKVAAAALRASSGVEVKGLEWRKEAQWAQARCRAVGLITVTQTDGRWDWRIEGSLCRSQCMSIDEAIAEVEEERIARILSCLSSPLPTVEVTDEMVERGAEALRKMYRGTEEDPFHLMSKAVLTAALSQNKGG